MNGRVEEALYLAMLFVALFGLVLLALPTTAMLFVMRDLAGWAYDLAQLAQAVS